MSRHRLTPPPRVRPRVGRMAAAAVALGVTGIALLSGIGVIDLDTRVAAEAQSTSASTGTGEVGSATGSAKTRTQSPTKKAPASTPNAPVSPQAQVTTSSAPPASSSSRTTGTALPAASGSGRRVVFSIADQRVWLVGKSGTAVSTYLVSGSVTKNLEPGDYEVYSRSRWAVGIDDSGVMQYFVRFAHGPNAAIGFHSIPTKNGKPLQSVQQLGTPQSHGCIRQKMTDAQRMWAFARTGTDVVVVA